MKRGIQLLLISIMSIVINTFSAVSTFADANRCDPQDPYALNLLERQKFNEKAWKSAAVYPMGIPLDVQHNGERIYMIRDLCATHKLLGMYKPAVLKLLGQPDKKQPKLFKYVVHTGAVGHGSTWLYIRFSNDRVERGWLRADANYYPYRGKDDQEGYGPIFFPLQTVF